MEDGNMPDVSEAIETYFAVWNEPDAAARQHLLEHVWADDGVLVQPRVGRVEGREAVLAHIGAFAQRFPGARVIRTSEVDEHHAFLRYTWRIVMADGSPLHEGIDIGKLSRDGRLQQIIEFDDPLRALA